MGWSLGSPDQRPVATFPLTLLHSPPGAEGAWGISFWGASRPGENVTVLRMTCHLRVKGALFGENKGRESKCYESFLKNFDGKGRRHEQWDETFRLLGVWRRRKQGQRRPIWGHGFEAMGRVRRTNFGGNALRWGGRHDGFQPRPQRTARQLGNRRKRRRTVDPVRSQGGALGRKRIQLTESPTWSGDGGGGAGGGSFRSEG